ncbi:unnamed protein product, partial [Tuber aestivum]
ESWLDLTREDRTAVGARWDGCWRCALRHDFLSDHRVHRHVVQQQKFRVPPVGLFHVALLRRDRVSAENQLLQVLEPVASSSPEMLRSDS